MGYNKELYRYLDTNGDGTGTKNAIGNYSSVATPFFISPGNGKSFEIHRMIISIFDENGMDSGKYGNNITLTNGIDIKKTVHGETISLADNVLVFTNQDWSRMCYDEKELSFGTGDDSVPIRWTFAKNGAPLRLSNADKLEVILNDDFTGLTGHYFFIGGQWTDDS